MASSNKAGMVVALLVVAVGIWAYRAGKFSTLAQAANGSLVVNR